MRFQDQKVEMEAKATWHHFGGKINWIQPKELGILLRSLVIPV
jgi:hypothetical protein